MVAQKREHRQITNSVITIINHNSKTINYKHLFYSYKACTFAYQLIKIIKK